MAKSNQILLINPPTELKFQGPSTTPVTSYIKLTNPSDKKLCFKIKTTAPKRYCVRPNSGIIDEQQTVEIAVTLQPFDFDSNEKIKHKFMVQSVIAPNTEDINLDEVWKNVSTDALMDSKLKCIFELPADVAAAAVNNPTNYLSDGDEASKTELIKDNVEAVESELQKANNEINRLKEELTRSQRENLQLKEDLIVQHQKAKSQPSLQHSVIPTPSHQISHVDSNQMPQMLYLAFGVFIGLLAMIIGKHIF